MKTPGPTFHLVDRYLGLRMGVDWAAVRAGQTAVVECPRRLGAEAGYGYVRAAWWFWHDDGRSAVSVPPGTARMVRPLVQRVRTAEQLFEPAMAEQLKAPVNAGLANAGLPGIDRRIVDLNFACDASLLRRHRCGDCRRLTGESIPAAEGIRLPKQCLPDGVAFGVIVEGQVVSLAFAHRTGVMEDCVADLAVGTVEPCQGKGYGKTAVSAVVEHFTSRGGQAIYNCLPGNLASIATACGVGFVPYGRSLILSSPLKKA